MASLTPHHHHHHLSLTSTTFNILHKQHSSPSLFHLSTTHPRVFKKISCCLSISNKSEDINTSDSTSKNRPSSNDQIRIMFAAGGTGGHIYPAIAIADDLKVIDPNIQILFIGNKNGIEITATQSAGYDFVSIPCYPLARPILLSPQNLIFPFLLIKSMIQSWKRLKDFNPQVVVGTGGYVSFPTCLTAALFRWGSKNKLVIQEQNSVPGFANRLLSYFAEYIFVAFPSSVRFYPKNRCIVSGNPIRLSLRQYVSKAVARMHFFPRSAKSWNSDSKVILVLGGSRNANSLNIAILNMYSQMLSKHKNRFIIWQTGIEAFDEMESLVKNHSRLVLTPYLHKIDLAYAAADLVVSRAGAMTCSEIMATGKPSILIPSLNGAEGHQMENAFVMEELAGSKVITEDELDSTTLAIAMEDIFGDERLMSEMSEKAIKTSHPEASAEIAQYILSLVKLSTNTTSKGE